MYTFTHDGVTITVQPAEQGRHTVVFLNGLFGGGWMWEPVVATLTAAGYGTVVTTEPLAAHETAEDIPALLQSISLLIDTLPDSSPILCGNSIGAFVAMELAAAEPSRWAGVILSGAPGLGDEQAADTVGSALRDPSLKLGDRIAGELIHDKELITPELVQRCTEALTPRILLRAGRALRATRGYDARPLLGRIDTSCPPRLRRLRRGELAREMAGRCPDVPRRRLRRDRRSGPFADAREAGRVLGPRGFLARHHCRAAPVGHRLTAIALEENQ